LLILMLGVLLWSWVDMGVEDEFGYWWIFVTHWTLLVECTYLGFAVYTTYRSLNTPPLADNNEAGEGGADKAAPWWSLASWVLQDVALPGSFVVFLLYWLLVFEPPLKLLSCLTHGLNFLVMAVDVVLSCQPFYLLHGAYFAAYCAIYILFTLIFWGAEGRNQDNDKFIYSSIDWGGDAGGAGATVGFVFIVGIPLVYLMLWILVYLRSNKSEAYSTLKNMPRDQEMAEV